MSIWDKIAKTLSYPQSVLTGITGFAPGMMGEGRNSTGNEELIKQALNFNKQLAPSQLMQVNQPDSYANSSAAAKIVGGAGSNLLYDPMLMMGGPEGALSKLAEGTKFEPVLKGANTLGKIGTETEKATVAAKAGQLGRRVYQGTLATGSLPQGLMAAGLIGGVENTAAKFLPKIAAKLLEEGINPDTLAKSEGALGKNIDEVLSETPLQKAAREAQDLTGQIGNANDSAMRAAAFKVQGVPQDPTGTSAMALQDALDKLDNFKASQIGQPELPAGPTAIPLGPARPPALNVAPTGQSAELNTALLKLLQDPKSRANLLLTLQNQRPLSFPGG